MDRRKFIQAAGFTPFLAKGLTTTQEIEHLAITDVPNSTRDFFYKPANGWAADFIPLYANGRFELFYLLDFRDPKKHGEGTPWYRISTTDFVHFEEHGEMIKRGTEKDQDLFIFTGCAIQADGKYHIFYTGHNHHLTKRGKPQQAVMHAVSDDMKKWTKIPGDTFFSPVDKYEKDDWRDPFVFFDEETKQYNMLLAARLKKGVSRRRGLTALCSSTDLKTWKVEKPFYAPGLYFTHECPDLFKIGDWWYLIFSEFTDKVQTRYRMSRSLKGPWITPANDNFDAHAFYAAKSASNGQKRYLFGWNPTRENNSDNGNWQWGGNLVVHEIYPASSGELLVKAPETVSNAFTQPLALSFTHGSGEFTWQNKTLRLTAPGTFAASVGGKLPDQCKISGKIEFIEGAREFGIMFRTSEDLDNSYFIRFEPFNTRVVFDKWPRARPELPQMAEFERPHKLSSTTAVSFELFIEGTKGVIYINDAVAMNFRAYDLPAGNWCFFATDATIIIKEIQLQTV